MKRLLLSLILSLPLFCSESRLIVDHRLSPYMGAQDLLAGYRLLMKAEDALIEQKTGLQPSLARIVELTAFWTPLSGITNVVQHEVFGHGYRIRDSYNAAVESYHFDWPDPYGDGGGVTKFFIGDKMRFGELIATNIAGIEAQEILARDVKMGWCVDQRIDGRMADLYFDGRQAFWLYTSVTDSVEIDVDGGDGQADIFGGNDIKAFVTALNFIYPEDKITVGYLRKRSLLNFIDPATFYSVYAFGYYVVCGTPAPFPMINLWGVSYLPNYKLSLSPYGLESYVENFFSKNNRPYYLYVRWGDRGGNTYWGAGFEGSTLFDWNWGSLGTRVDIWQQPDFFKNVKLFDVLDGKASAAKLGHGQRWGGAGSLIFKFHMTQKKGHMDFFLESGYKSRGYLQGYALNNTVIARLGLASKF